LVRVANQLGEVVLRARVTDQIVPGTVLAPGIWWNKCSSDRRNINQITPQAETDMGGGATFYDTLVSVAPLPAAQQLPTTDQAAALTVPVR
ncbi:MAG: hypothetical protein KDE31_32070, partial [Caldilineaceae bacterium]|nr:hypothetical protein [Caldilineaceae bacterium]